MISEWMEHGTIMEFIIEYPGVNRLNLVRIYPMLPVNTAQQCFLSWQMFLVG